MWRAAAVLFAFAWAAGCQKATSPRDEAAPQTALRVTLPAAVPAQSIDAGPDASAIDFGPKGPLDVVPKIPPLEKGMMDHAFAVGWATSGQTLGQCHQGMVVECDFLALDGKKETAGLLPDDPARAQKEKALRARAAAMGLGTAHGEWAFARDLEVTWQVVLGSQDTKPPVPGVLKVGARVRGKKASFSITLSETSTGYHDRIHPEAIALSPDGTYLGVVAHAYSGEYGDTFPMAIVPVARLAAQAYAAAGLPEKAAAADPTVPPK
ncbi:MAG: hypothetical protein ABIP39_04950 [Polyangiaceae bacterium]